MQHNPSSITELQTYDIPQNINIYSRRVDLNYKGNDATDPSDTLVLSGVKADVNRVLFWLSSKRNDYVRSSLKGGVLYDMIGLLANEDNFDFWKNELKSRFNSEFNQEMILLYLDFSINKKTRTLKIYMTVQDRLLGVTFPVNTEASI